jgi:SagB-type dehydrogenase family enzyme
MDGTRTVAEMLSNLPIDERVVGARMLAVLAATGAVDASGRSIGRFLHSATKKGVIPGGGLEKDEVLQLATDGNYRAYPDAPRIAVGHSVPDRLHSFHALTRSRRSRRDYLGHAVRREDFDALLYTACGVTGAMPWAGREVKLRAYPASGALYAVEIYPVVFRVEGLEPGVYHYRAVENVLEVVRADIDRAHFVSAALPVEREMVAGAATMICLAGFFPRHERKYGQGGYRMLVAEAGHISQSLIFAATALGLNARPFGGVFDDLLNREIGLDGEEEQFLLAVLAGHTGGT